MKKLIILITSFYGIMIIVSFFYAVSTEFDLAKGTVTEMNTIVNSAHKYSISQVQDIDRINKSIRSIGKARTDYKAWLEAMSDNCKFTVDYDGSTRKETTNSSDISFSKDIIQFLSEDYSKPIDNSFGYSPLNFGITYIDKTMLEQDMLKYILDSIEMDSKDVSISRSGRYRVDPRTVKVSAKLTATPIDLSKTDTKSSQTYLQIFGLHTPSDIHSDKFVSISDIKTVVRYDIEYSVTYDYIPNSSWFTVPRKYTKEYASNSTPPEHIFFPRWYDKSGNVENNINNKLSYAKLKFYLTKPFTYKYDYMLTN